jgi:putative nucleotidyltransferase with HDIG domain
MAGIGSKAAAAPLEQLAGLLDGDLAWLVGGAIRDALLGRPHPDYDVAVRGDAERLARALARAGRGFVFALSDAWGSWRVSARDRSWQLDLTPLTAPDLAGDLRRRDLTINAIAQPLRLGMSVGAETLIDPFGGVADLRAKRLRAVSDQSFAVDPLRVLRLARLEAELGGGFVPEPGAVALAQAAAPGLDGVAPERILTELLRLLCSDAAVAGIERLRELDALAVVLPELVAERGLAQSVYHNLDVYDHTLAALQHAIDLERDLASVFGASADRLGRFLAQPLANELTRAQALRLGVLLHDIAKPLTRGVAAEGRVTFFAHDREGAALVTSILTRLRAAAKLTSHVAALARHHLRLGFLVHERPLSRRQVYDYLHVCEPVGVDVTVLGIADRVATGGKGAESAIAAHLDLAAAMIGPALDYAEMPPQAPIRGDELAAALGVPPGPVLGPLLAELTAAAYAGQIAAGDRQALVAYAREWLDRQDKPATER